MGILDDAIREHLDLKRRRGADPTEIERAEREALGPVRRGPEVTGEQTAPGAPETEPEAADSPEPAEQWEGFHEDPEHLQHGRLGERAAKKFLQSQGLKFLVANFGIPGRGEIDLIFREADCLLANNDSPKTTRAI